LLYGDLNSVSACGSTRVVSDANSSSAIDFSTVYALLGPKIVKLAAVRSDDVGFPSIQLLKGRQRCSEKWMAKPVCVTLGPLPTIQIAISFKGCPNQTLSAANLCLSVSRMHHADMGLRQIRPVRYGRLANWTSATFSHSVNAVVLTDGTFVFLKRQLLCWLTKENISLDRISSFV
jgi:hypothetical protein